MRTAGFFLHNFSGIFAAGVDGEVRAHAGRQLQLFVVNVQGDDFGVKDVFGVLQREVAQPAQPVNRNPLARFNTRHLHRFVGCHASAGNAAGRRRIQTVRHFYRVIRGDDALFRHAAVDGVTGVFHVTAQGFVAGITVFAVAAAFKEPGHTCAVTDFQRLHARADFFHDTNSFMAQDNPGLVAKITVLHVKIGMAYATALHLQQGFPMLKRA